MEGVNKAITEWVTPIVGSDYDYGDSYGDGYGFGYGSGCGDGDGSGSGCGYGFGNGDGSGSGCGIKVFYGQAVYYIDGVYTIITAIFGNYAKGMILNNDLTTTPCYIAKRDSIFAHGETLRKAEQALLEKLYDLELLDERIDRFVESHKWGDKYPAEDFYSWHHILTGSCEMGRKAFAKDHGIDIEHDVMTVEQFLTLTENNYGGEIIKEVKERYEREN